MAARTAPAKSFGETRRDEGAEAVEVTSTTDDFRLTFVDDGAAVLRTVARPAVKRASAWASGFFLRCRTPAWLRADASWFCPWPFFLPLFWPGPSCRLLSSGRIWQQHPPAKRLSASRVQPGDCAIRRTPGRLQFHPCCAPSGRSCHSDRCRSLRSRARHAS